MAETIYTGNFKSPYNGQLYSDILVSIPTAGGDTITSAYSPEEGWILATYNGPTYKVERMTIPVSEGEEVITTETDPKKAKKIVSDLRYITNAGIESKKLVKEQNGGNMNYSQYLAGGGLLQQAKQALQLGMTKEQVVEQLLQQGDEGVQTIQEWAQEDPEIVEIANQLVKNALGRAQAYKCGGSVQKKHTKIRKAACGTKTKKASKKEEGGEIDLDKCGGKAKKKVKKAENGAFVKQPCPCMLKKVGGKIISVDSCTGLPMKREGGSIIKFSIGGGVEKFEEPWKTIGENGQPLSAPSTAWGRGATDYGAYEKDGQLYWKDEAGQEYVANRGLFGNIKSWDHYTAPQATVPQNTQTTTPTFKPTVTDRNFGGVTGSVGNAYFTTADGKKYYKTSTGKWMPTGVRTAYTSAHGANLDQETLNNLEQAYDYYHNWGGKNYKDNGDGTYSKYGSNDVYRIMKADDGSYGYATDGGKGTWNAETGTYDREGYTFGFKKDGNTYKSVWTKNQDPVVENLLPEVEVKAPQMTAGQRMFLNSGLSDTSLTGRQLWVRDNADYLKTQGWDDTRINAYKGSAVDNRALLSAVLGKRAWDQELLEAAAAKQANAGLTRLSAEPVKFQASTTDMASLPGANTFNTIYRNNDGKVMVGLLNNVFKGISAQPSVMNLRFKQGGLLSYSQYLN